MSATITVLVIGAEAIAAADGDLWNLIVCHRETGDVGSVLVTDEAKRDLLGECPTSDLVAIERERITWRLP